MFIGCPLPTPPSDGDVNYTDAEAGSVVTYSCHVGFRLLGRNNRQCLITGEWESTAPTCTRKGNSSFVTINHKTEPYLVSFLIESFFVYSLFQITIKILLHFAIKRTKMII